MENYKERHDEYSKRSPNLNDYQIKELIVIDFLADAIKNNFEVPKDSYQNRKSEYWKIEGNYKKLKYTLSKLKRQFLKLFNLVKTLSDDETQNLLDDIANDVLNNAFHKFGTELSEQDQLTNYEETIAKDEKAKGIVEHFQSLGMLLTGSLALRKTGTLYRSKKENLHDLDFTITSDGHGDFFNNLIDELNTNLKGASEMGKGFMYEMFAKNLKDNYKKHPLIFKIKEKYPSFEVTNSFKGLTENSVTVSGKIGDHIIDLFFVEDEDLSQGEKGFQDWQSIFKAKIQMGRDKDMKDLSNYIPFNMQPTDEHFKSKGFRHFNFAKISKKDVSGFKELVSKEISEEFPTFEESMDEETKSEC
jgi:hypothetical protein